MPVRAFVELLVALKGTISVALRRARPTTLAAGGLVVALFAVGGLYVAASGSDSSGTAGDRGDDHGAVSTGPGSGEGDRSDGPAAVDAEARWLEDGEASQAAADVDPDGAGGSGDDAVDGGSTDAPAGGRDAGGEPLAQAAAPSSTSPSTSSSPSGSTSTTLSGAAPTTTQGTGTTTTAPPTSSDGGLFDGLLELLGLG